MSAPFGDLTGQTLDDRYAIKRKAGAGSMGDVYEAEHLATGRHVAIKVLKAERMHHEVFLKRFIREARSASMVRHPNVVEIIEVGHVEGGPAFFVMEYLEGEDLDTVLEREGALPWPRVREILLQLTSALTAAHERGVVHRDIKPSNALRLFGTPDDEDRIKLVDFGVAKLGVDMVTRELTKADDVVGTALYMSPEQAVGDPADARSDIYALGIVAYELSTGRVPFPGDDIFTIMSAQLKDPPIPPRTLVPELPSVAERIILHALEKKPTNRFQTMREFEEALQTMSLPEPEPEPKAGGAGAAVVEEDGTFDDLPTTWYTPEQLKAQTAGLVPRPGAAQDSDVLPAIPMPSPIPSLDSGESAGDRTMISGSGRYSMTDEPVMAFPAPVGLTEVPGARPNFSAQQPGGTQIPGARARYPESRPPHPSQTTQSKRATAIAVVFTALALAIIAATAFYVATQMM